MTKKTKPDANSFNMKNLLEKVELEGQNVYVFYDQEYYGFASAGTDKNGNGMVVFGNQIHRFTLEQRGVILEHEFGHLIQQRNKVSFDTTLLYEFDADQYAAKKFGYNAVVDVIERTIEICLELGKDSVDDLLNRMFYLQGMHYKTA